VNQLLEARKQMAKMMKAMGSGKMPQFGTPPAARPTARKTKSKRKKKAKR
jgi:hypothetical protein